MKFIFKLFKFEIFQQNLVDDFNALSQAFKIPSLSNFVKKLISLKS